ncbi:hypothetical protein PR048_010408 [Dryococelus australis]|uniref:Uncharacterized protein n=1 Tax=Dryococelus australis TaxID=614101 RepID=A0ABQ9I2M5_9NEOP|nr:hypothetical protein PR048_010408 [Dryococelus australis]
MPPKEQKLVSNTETSPISPLDVAIGDWNLRHKVVSGLRDHAGNYEEKNNSYHAQNKFGPTLRDVQRALRKHKKKKTMSQQGPSRSEHNSVPLCCRQTKRNEKQKDTITWELQQLRLEPDCIMHATCYGVQFKGTGRPSSNRTCEIFILLQMRQVNAFRRVQSLLHEGRESVNQANTILVSGKDTLWTRVASEGGRGIGWLSLGCRAGSVWKGGKGWQAGNYRRHLMIVGSAHLVEGRRAVAGSEVTSAIPVGAIFSHSSTLVEDRHVQLSLSSSLHLKTLGDRRAYEWRGHKQRDILETRNVCKFAVSIKSWWRRWRHTIWRENRCTKNRRSRDDKTSSLRQQLGEDVLAVQGSRTSVRRIDACKQDKPPIAWESYETGGAKETKQDLIKALHSFLQLTHCKAKGNKRNGNTRLDMDLSSHRIYSLALPRSTEHFQYREKPSSTNISFPIVAMSGSSTIVVEMAERERTRPFVLREYVYVDALGRLDIYFAFPAPLHSIIWGFMGITGLLLRKDGEAGRKRQLMKEVLGLCYIHSRIPPGTRSSYGKLCVCRVLHAVNKDDPDRHAGFCKWVRNMCDDYEHFTDVIGLMREHLNLMELSTTTAMCTGPLKIATLRGIVGPFFSNLSQITIAFSSIDGAPPHYHRDLGSLLHETLVGSSLNPRGGVEYPPRSHRFNAVRFLLIITQKNSMYPNKATVTGRHERHDFDGLWIHSYENRSYCMLLCSMALHTISRCF